MAGRREHRAMRAWPGVLAPMGLTCLFLVCVCLFYFKLEADREAVFQSSVRLESYALAEARDKAAAARQLAHRFVTERQSQRLAQERNLRLEAKRILDAAYSLITTSLEKTGKRTASRREVGEFPPGFEGMRMFLEIAPRSANEDLILDALNACAPELAFLLPTGCSLAVIEDNAKQIFSLGGGLSGGEAVSVALARDVLFNDAARTRHWSLRIDLSEADKFPDPTPQATAEYLASEMSAASASPDVAWRGWLLAGGDPVGMFAHSRAREETLPPFINVTGEWIDLDGKRLVWLERPAAAPGLEWQVAVSVAIDRPPELPAFMPHLLADSRWSITLAVLACLSLGCWLWFLLSLGGGGHDAPAAPARQQPAALQTPPPPQAKRLVRDPELRRTVPENQGLIVADIDDGGAVWVDKRPVAREAVAVAPKPGAPAPASAPEPDVMPSGSLARLQATHRGREGLPGSRVLDQAKSPILRELARRVRPPEKASRPATRPNGKTTAL